MANLSTLIVLTVLSVLAFATVAEAMSLSRCARMLRDGAGREAVRNTCDACVTVKIERRRPGQSTGVPNVREYNIPSGTVQPLPFRGPGLTRIVGETACPVVGAQ